jgi:5-methylcytosine-specific restriction endonuclease McrA
LRSRRCDRRARWQPPKNFYKHQRWLDTREDVLIRDDYLCQHCLAKGIIKAATEVHHIKKLIHCTEDEAYDPDNLVSLCWECHEKTKDGKADSGLENYILPVEIPRPPSARNRGSP